MPKEYKSKDANYVQGNFKTTRRPKSPSPKRADYRKVAVKKDDHTSRCTYIHPNSGRRCTNLLGLYPEFCKLHTMMVYNLYIDKSNIEAAGNGLFTGPYGFKKGDVIGKYNKPWNSVSMGRIEKRCKGDNCYSYVFCEDGQDSKTKCWDGLDIRSTLMRNINDAHGSKHRNNAFFDVVKGDVLVIASRDIKGYKEIFVTYGKDYWQ